MAGCGWHFLNRSRGFCQKWRLDQRKVRFMMKRTKVSNGTVNKYGFRYSVNSSPRLHSSIDKAQDSNSKSVINPIYNRATAIKEQVPSPFIILPQAYCRHWAGNIPCTSWHGVCNCCFHPSGPKPAILEASISYLSRLGMCP